MEDEAESHLDIVLFVNRAGVYIAWVLTLQGQIHQLFIIPLYHLIMLVTVHS